MSYAPSFFAKGREHKGGVTGTLPRDFAEPRFVSDTVGGEWGTGTKCTGGRGASRWTDFLKNNWPKFREEHPKTRWASYVKQMSAVYAAEEKPEPKRREPKRRAPKKESSRGLSPWVKFLRDGWEEFKSENPGTRYIEYVKIMSGRYSGSKSAAPKERAAPRSEISPEMRHVRQLEIEHAAEQAAKQAAEQVAEHTKAVAEKAAEKAAEEAIEAAEQPAGGIKMPKKCKCKYVEKYKCGGKRKAHPKNVHKKRGGKQSHNKIRRIHRI